MTLEERFRKDHPKFSVKPGHIIPFGMNCLCLGENWHPGQVCEFHRSRGWRTGSGINGFVYHKELDERLREADND